jgi:AraC-like DNA-binding protein
MFQLFFSITILSIFITSILVIFFLVTKKGQANSNRILATLLVLFGLQIFYAFSVSNYGFLYFLKYHKILILLKQVGLLTGPALFLYIKSFQSKSFSWTSSLIHITPFVITIIYIPFVFYGKTPFILWENPIDPYTTLLIFAQNLVYIVFSVFELKNSGKSIHLFFRELKESTHFAWLQYLLIGFITLWTFNVNSFAIIMIVKKPDWCATTGAIFSLISFLFINLLMFILLLKPEIYYIIEKYKGFKLDSGTKQEYIQQLSFYIENKKPYLLPEISLQTVSEDTGISTRILSQIINQTYSNNFNGYINSLRIQECIRQLSDSQNNKTVLEILFEAGFNSKSVFYKEFKKVTDLSPQEFRIYHQKKINENWILN